MKVIELNRGSLTISHPLQLRREFNQNGHLSFQLSALATENLLNK